MAGTTFSLLLDRGLLFRSRWAIWADQFVAINGNRAMLILSVDGVNNTTDNSNPPSFLLEAIAEFKVQTNAMAAPVWPFGWRAINVSIKSGTNQYHGVFRFIRNDKLDANNFFNSGRPKPRSAEPVWLHVWRTRSPETELLSLATSGNPAASRPVGFVPNPDERLGDFSRSGLTIFDPQTSSSPNGAGIIRDPFAGNVIPDNRISPAAKRSLLCILANMLECGRTISLETQAQQRCQPVRRSSEFQFSPNDSVFGRIVFRGRSHQSGFPGNCCFWNIPFPQ
jgi:hypothetical protein